MSKANHLIVIGGGPAGYVGALHAAAEGLAVTLVDAGSVGGTCLHRGCIPTKALVAACSLLERVKRAGLFGIRIQGEVSAPWSEVRDHVGDTVKGLTRGVESLLADRGVEHVRAHASMRDAHTVEIDGGRTISGDRILICTGSRPVRPAAFSFDGRAVCTSDDLLAWESLPASVVIVGEGVIACELAFILRALGTAVTMVGMDMRPLPMLDADLSAVITRELKRKKIAFLGGRRVERLRAGTGEVEVIGADGPIAAAERVLVCIGRAPQADTAGLQAAGVSFGPRGEVLVDSAMRTTLPGVYAAGDVTGRVMLAHAASAQARLAVDHMLGKPVSPIDEDRIPWAIFTAPEIGCVGLSEEAALRRGHQVRCGRFDFKGLGKAQVMDELAGLVKIVAERESGRLLGVHIAGAHASDIIHEAVVALHTGCTAEELRAVIHAHPALSEAMAEAVEDLLGQATHKPIRKTAHGISA